MKQSFKEKNLWSFLTTVFGILCLVGMIFALMEYKPPYKDSNSSVEYLWGKLTSSATKKVVISPDSVLWISACINYDSAININKRVLRIKLNINQVEQEDIYLEEHKGTWEIKKSLKDEQIIRIAYMHF